MEAALVNDKTKHQVQEEWLVGAVVSVLQGQVDAEWTQGVV